MRGPYIGSMHDAGLVTQSGIHEDLSEFSVYDDVEQPNYYVYGDPAYRRSAHIQRPYKRARNTAEQEHMNAEMSRVRVSVEHSIGHLTNIFPALDFVREEKLGLKLIGMKYLVAVMLRNFITCVRGGNQISKYFRCSTPSLKSFTSRRGR